jgi:glutamate-1-semialdehyde 2,1-aminomutase
VGAALQRGWSFGATHVDEIRLAELVCQRFPSIEQVRFTNSGTEANLMALQLARHCTGRDPSIAVFDHSVPRRDCCTSATVGEALQAPFDYVRMPYNDIDGVRAPRLTTRSQRSSSKPMMGAGRLHPCGARDSLPGSATYAIARTTVELRRGDDLAHELRWCGSCRCGVHPGPEPRWASTIAGGMTFGAFGGRADLMARVRPAARRPN